MKTTAKAKRINWTELPDSADERIKAALSRQAAKCGFDSVDDYIHSTITQNLLNDEEDSVILDDGRIVDGWELEH